MQSIPDWLFIKLSEQYKDCAKEIVRGYSVRRPVTLRVNTLKTNPAAVADALQKNGISCRATDWYGDALIAEGADERDIVPLDIYTRGEIYLQSLSSMLPPLYLQARAADNVLDMTAAPGGKTAQISALSGGQTFITACEKDKIRSDRLRFNLERQGVPRVTVLNADALKLDEFFSFDRILLDAPCSGSGTLSPDAPVKISEALVRNSVEIQEKLLLKALKLLKKGGTLVYSTCSVLQEENDAVVERVLKRTGCTLEPISAFEGIPVLQSLEGTVCVCPNELYEGFFVAKLRKP